jgi:hypothetical protein
VGERGAVYDTLMRSSHMSRENGVFRVGVVAGVEHKIEAPTSWGRRLLNEVGALNRGYCWSCS